MNDLSNTVIKGEDGVVTGFETKRIEGAFEITTAFTLEGAVQSETSEKIFSGVALTDLSSEFQAAWSEVSNDLGAAFSGSLLFEEDGDTISILDGANLIGYATSWQNTGSREDVRTLNDSPVQLTIIDNSYGYEIFDENWNELASTGSSTRSITEADGNVLSTLVVDEENVSKGYQSSKSAYAGDWDALDPNVAAITWDDVASVRVKVNTTTNMVSGNTYRDGETQSAQANTEYQFYSADGAFIGTTELRDGVTEVRDGNWNLVARKADLSKAFTFAEMSSDLGANWDAAWQEINKYLPDDFKPGAAGDYTQLKFNYDQWENILIFSPNGEMIGRIGSWSGSNASERPWNSDWEIRSHQNFTFNDNQGNDVARFDVNEQHASTDGTDKIYLDGSSVQVSYGVSKYDYDNAQAVVGLNADVDWSEMEALFNLPVGYGDLLFSNGWDTDVDFISIGTNTRKNYQHDDNGNAILDDSSQPKYDEETSTRVEFFDVKEGHREFLGVMEVRDGFIEIRDQHWNQIAKIVDASSAMGFADVAKAYEGFEEAWGLVSSYLPSEMANKATLKFTSDDYNIFVFDATGALVSQVNYWTGNNDNEWTDWNNGNGSEITIQESRYNYNFHDDNWQSIAHAGVNKNYITKVDGVKVATPILHEQGESYGYRVTKEDYIKANGDDASKWAELDPTDPKINWETVSEIQLNSNKWSSVANEYREGDAWTDDNEQVEYFKKIVDGDGSSTYTERVGSMEMRDGFIEVRDAQWNLVARKVDVSETKTYAEVATKYGQAFEDAWGKIGSYLSSDFTPTVTDVNVGTEYKNLKFSYGDWNDILVFSPDGKMVGRINSWGNEDVQDRPWNGDYQFNEHISFNFNDADWNEIARYEASTNQGSSDGVAKDGNVESRGENISYTVAKKDVDATAWGDLKALYDLPSSLTTQQAQQLFQTDWDTDVDYISIGTNTWKNYQFEDDGQPTMENGQPAYNEEKSTRIEFFDIRNADEHGNGGHREFLGVMEVRDGFIEIRDQHWNDVAKIVDSSAAMNFAEVSQKYEGFAEALFTLDEYLPDVVDVLSNDGKAALTLAEGTNLKFTSDDENIYISDATGAVTLVVRVRLEDQTYFDFGREYSDERVEYKFKDANYNRLAETTVKNTYVDVDGAKVLDIARIKLGYTVSMSDAETDTSIDLPDFSQITDPSLALQLTDAESVTIQTRTWESYEHAYRSAGDTWTGGNETLQFRDEHRHTLGSVETEGGLVSIYDAHWNVVDSYLSTTAQGDSLKKALKATDDELEVYFHQEMLSELPDYENYEIIDAGEGLSFLVLNGEIKGKVFIEKNDFDDREWYSYRVEDVEGRQQFKAGVGKNPHDTQPPIEPHTVYVSTYAHRDLIATDQEGQSAWNTILSNPNFGIVDPDFNPADVSIIETQKQLIDNSENDSRDPYEQTVYRFIKENSAGKDVWDYFKVVEGAGVRTVEKSDGYDWEVISQTITNSGNFLSLPELGDLDPGAAAAAKYMLDKTQALSKLKFDEYFGANFDADTQFLTNAATMSFVVNDDQGKLIGTAYSDERFNSSDNTSQISIVFDLVAIDDPVEVTVEVSLDSNNDLDFTKAHTISLGHEYLIENYTEGEWKSLIDVHVPTGVDGLDSTKIGVIYDSSRMDIDPSNGSQQTKQVIEFIPFKIDGNNYDYLWSGWDETYNVKIADQITSIRLGSKILDQSVDFSALTAIIDKEALTTFNSDLVKTLDFVGLDLISDFDLYKSSGSEHLYLTKKGTTEVVLFMKESASEWNSNGYGLFEVAYDIYTIKGKEYVGWISQSLPDQRNPMDDTSTVITGAVNHGSQFVGIKPEELTDGQFAQLKALGTPVDSKYSFDNVTSFGIGQLVFEVGGVAELDAVTIQHEIDGADDNWVGRLLYEMTQGMQLSENPGEDTKPNGEDLTAEEVTQFSVLKADLTDSALSNWAAYDPSTQQGTEAPLNNLNEYNQVAQEIVDATGYLKDIFSKMSATDLGNGEARLELGSGNQSAKIIIKDVSSAWAYNDDGETLAGFKLSDQASGGDGGWIWKSVVDDYGILDAADPSKSIETQIFSFELNDVLDAVPAAILVDLEVLGVSLSSSPSYSLQEIDDIHLQREIHIEMDSDGNVVSDSDSGSPKVVSDRHMIFHVSKGGELLGGVGFDAISGTPFDFKQDFTSTPQFFFGSSLNGNIKSDRIEDYENIFGGVVQRFFSELATAKQLGDLTDIDLSSDYNQLVGDQHGDTVSGLKVFKSSGTDLDGFVPFVDLGNDSDQSTGASAFNDSLSSAWSTKLIDFETSAPGNFAVSSYTASSADFLANQSGNMNSGATGELVIQDSVSVTLFNTANEAGDGGNNGDDPGIASNIGNDADRGFNVTSSGDQYLEVLVGENLSGGVLFGFDALMAPVYGVSFTLMGVEETKRDVSIDVHLSDGNILRETADKHIAKTGGYQFYGFSLDENYAQSTSIEGLVVYEAFDGEFSSARDIFALDDVTIVYGDAYDKLSTIDPSKDYDLFVAASVQTNVPSYLSRFVSDRLELDGTIPSTFPEAAVEAGKDLTSYYSTVTEFADTVAIMSDELGFVVHDFESSAPGNFAVTGYTAKTGEAVKDQSGDMASGANGTLISDGILSVSLFNTKANAAGDDPGIATHVDNNADRGFNTTVSGSQYLEILPSEDGPGGALFSFDEINVPVHGFGFNLLGTEGSKRDVSIDVHMSDGLIYREIAEAHADETGGHQYYSYLVDSLLSDGASIEGFVLYQDDTQTDGVSGRDIFGVDDIALVVSDAVAGFLTPLEFVETQDELIVTQVL